MHIVIGVLIAFVMVAIFSRRSTRKCRWRMDRSRDEGGQRFYHCVACGQSCLVQHEGPPKECLKPIERSGPEV